MLISKIICSYSKYKGYAPHFSKILENYPSEKKKERKKNNKNSTEV